ncbi:MAG: type II toxin-antitoxin system mRNA interferase toxin, RelE/StbE family [Patescibacteria group bacterium]|nr:type II toxin-antitoxin system mRNA interferase toxin, RelE/StbE family [Patescibacteria group bacterium]
MQIKYTPRFKKSYDNLPNYIKKKAERKVEIFKENPFDKWLETHKLSGNLEGVRIAFKFNDDGDAIFLRTGDHDIYR